MTEGPYEKPGVCILIGAFYPVVGGGETHARILGRELVRRGTPVTLITRRSSRGLNAREIRDGIRVHRVWAPASPRLGKYAMLLPAMLRLVALRKEYDIIYVCALRVLGVAGVLAARVLGKRCVLRSEACGELSGDFIRKSFHSDTPTHMPPLVRALLAWRNRLFMRADCFLSISSLIDEEFRRCGVPADKMISISCGVDTERFTPVDEAGKRRWRAALKLPDRFTFVYAGKLNKGKGLDHLLSAWRELAQHRDDIHLLLVGGGDEHSLSCEGAVRAEVDAGSMADSVSFTGYVQNVEAYLQASDAFVFPSLQESFGLAPLEAMACGLPVVATRVGALPRIITDGENGLLVEPGNVEELVRAMSRVLADANGASGLAQAGRRTVVTQLGIGRVAEAHEALFARLCTGRNGG